MNNESRKNQLPYLYKFQLYIFSTITCTTFAKTGNPFETKKNVQTAVQKLQFTMKLNVSQATALNWRVP